METVGENETGSTPGISHVEAEKRLSVRVPEGQTTTVIKMLRCEAKDAATKAAKEKKQEQVQSTPYTGKAKGLERLAPNLDSLQELAETSMKKFWEIYLGTSLKFI